MRAINFLFSSFLLLSLFVFCLSPTNSDASFDYEDALGFVEKIELKVMSADRIDEPLVELSIHLICENESGVVRYSEVKKTNKNGEVSFTHVPKGGVCTLMYIDKRNEIDIKKFDNPIIQRIDLSSRQSALIGALQYEHRRRGIYETMNRKRPIVSTALFPLRKKTIDLSLWLYEAKGTSSGTQYHRFSNRENIGKIICYRYGTGRFEKNTVEPSMFRIFNKRYSFENVPAGRMCSVELVRTGSSKSETIYWFDASETNHTLLVGMELHHAVTPYEENLKNSLDLFSTDPSFQECFGQMMSQLAAAHGIESEKKEQKKMAQDCPMHLCEGDQCDGCLMCQTHADLKQMAASLEHVLTIKTPSSELEQITDITFLDSVTGKTITGKVTQDGDVFVLKNELEQGKTYAVWPGTAEKPIPTKNAISTWTFKQKKSTQVSSLDFQIGSLNLSFENDDSKISSRSLAEFQPLIQHLKAFPHLRMKIDGYSNSEGETGYNLELSSRRASAVRNYLVSKGIAKERLLAQGHGSRDLIFKDAEGTIEDLEKSRRVEVTPLLDHPMEKKNLENLQEVSVADLVTEKETQQTPGKRLHSSKAPTATNKVVVKPQSVSSSTMSSGNSAEIDRILKKPIEAITPDERKLLLDGKLLNFQIKNPEKPAIILIDTSGSMYPVKRKLLMSVMRVLLNEGKPHQRPVSVGFMSGEIVLHEKNSFGRNDLIELETAIDKISSGADCVSPAASLAKKYTEAEVYVVTDLANDEDDIGILECVVSKFGPDQLHLVGFNVGYYSMQSWHDVRAKFLEKVKIEKIILEGFADSLIEDRILKEVLFKL